MSSRPFPASSSPPGADSTPGTTAPFPNRLPTTKPAGLGAAHVAAWNDFIEQSVGALSAGLKKLREDGQPPPDECGYELAENAVIIAECELAWFDRKVVLLLEARQDAGPVWSERGWTPIVAQEGWVERLAAALSRQGTP
jgi:hypothetical protein